MNTKEFVIDDDTMDALRDRAKRDCIQLEDLVDRYILLITNLQDKIRPEFRELQRINALVFNHDVDFNWKEELSNELCPVMNPIEFLVKEV